MKKTNKHKLVILGSTGSIGTQALEIVDNYPHTYQVVGLAAKDEVELVSQQIKKYKPEMVSISSESAYLKLKEEFGDKVHITLGLDGLCEVAALDSADTVLVALSGAVGILPTLSAIKAKKRIALANKETLVAAGDIVMEEVRKNQVELIPVDSEHSAVFQCLLGEEKYLENIWLTASGGPFRNFTIEELAQVTVDMALKHPNWNMGPKITIDSATLMNKGLEVIEAHHLFAIPYDNIKVVIQPESIIHSMVEFNDGSILAHLGTPNMKIPIQYALTYPGRMDTMVEKLDFYKLNAIHFSKPDEKRFPALRLAYEAGKLGATMPAVMNAANEVAVNYFLKGKLKFTDIPHIVELVMQEHNVIKNVDLSTLLEIDNWARKRCDELVKKGVS
ncbi:MAG: 1-deoxy-D-xylulose-5-phosphate reductoisomerase [Syntrophomonadaceae bacterium]|nr:1-deoxy-D-xylulose-5-phosphate reductoisomerase [Syntrophomonadaceae bacterium]